ncbi:MAG: dihydrolipoyl dehydrogenase [Armatimonadetes bacterium]|nr:dihydrolipoyl dehydrogenase [Armatimonadota bacterium]
MSDLSYDLVIIGGGPAGYVGAIRAAQLGARVAVVERDAWGGTCLNRGCIPSKALIHAVEALALAKEAKAFGIAFGEPTVNWEGLRDYKSRVVKQLRSGVETLLDGNKVTKLAGRGKLLGADEVQVTGEDGTQQVLRARKVLLATGAVPLIPPVPGLDACNVFTSDQAVDLPGPFESLVVVGAGAVGCEFAYIYSQLGTKVALFEMLPHVLPTEDADVADVLAKCLKRAGVKIFCEAKVLGVREVDGRKHVEYDCQGKCETVEADAVLLAVGRRAAIADIGLEEVGVETHRPGICVNERLETSVAGVYAAGDCLRGVGLAHLASHEAIAAVENALGEGGHVNYDCVPAAIYTHPEVASVGLTQTKAAEKGVDVTVGTFPFAANSRAVATRQREGLVKLIAEAATGRLLGASIVGPNASELIAEAALAIQLGAKAADLAETIHSHPTLSEAVHEAALDVLGRCLHMPPRKG